MPSITPIAASGSGPAIRQIQSSIHSSDHPLLPRETIPCTWIDTAEALPPVNTIVLVWLEPDGEVYLGILKTVGHLMDGTPVDQWHFSDTAYDLDDFMHVRPRMWASIPYPSRKAQF